MLSVLAQNTVDSLIDGINSGRLDPVSRPDEVEAELKLFVSDFCEDTRESLSMARQASAIPDLLDAVVGFATTFMLPILGEDEERVLDAIARINAKVAGIAVRALMTPVGPPFGPKPSPPSPTPPPPKPGTVLAARMTPTLLDELAARHQCRNHLAGVQVRHRGRIATIAHTTWGPGSELIVTLVGGEKVSPEDLTLASKWPVSSCCGRSLKLLRQSIAKRTKEGGSR